MRSLGGRERRQAERPLLRLTYATILSSVKDFALLVSLGLFNSALMNDAVYKFKRYEDPSLNYTGINKHEGEDFGLYDTVITRQDAQKVFENVPARAL